MPFDTTSTSSRVMSKKEKQRHQVKSRFYYLFWGAATVSVFVGQMYVGSGYRKMSKSIDRVVDTITFEVQRMSDGHDPMRYY